ncbi:MAG: hypothetical protein ABIM31_03765 [candidate division WOR-3 bacterium]
MKVNVKTFALFTFLSLFAFVSKVYAICPICLGVAVVGSTGSGLAGNLSFPIWFGMLVYALERLFYTKFSNKANTKFEKKEIGRFRLILTKIFLTISSITFYILGGGIAVALKKSMSILYLDSTVFMLFYLGVVATHFCYKLYRWQLISLRKPFHIKYGDTILATAVNLILTGVVMII